MLWWLTQNAAAACVLTVVVVLLCRMAHPRPAVRHALWLLVLVKLLSPTWLVLPWSWPEETPVIKETPPVAVAMVPPPVVYTPPPAVNAPDSPMVTAPQPAPRAVVHAAPPVVEPQAPPTVSPPSFWEGWSFTKCFEAAFAIWMGCAVLMGLLQLTRIVRLARRSGRGETAPDWLLEQIEVQAKALGILPPRVRVVPGTGSPHLACFGHPVLVVPKMVLDRLPAKSWPSILVHELAHLRRRDHWVVWIELTATCLWWWFPLFWLVRRELRANAELACDAWVVATLPEHRRDYAEALLDVFELSGSAEPLPALTLGGGACELLERRLTMILRDRTPARLPLLALVLVGLVAVVVLPGWLPGQKPASEMPKPLEPEASLKKARVDGKYEMLVAQFKDEAGAEMHGAFKDLGLRNVREMGKQRDLPRGHWVYVYPYYYIFRDLAAAPKPSRAWGTEQATGEPNTTEAGDIQTAWASRNPDGTDEWLLMEYPEAVIPRAVMVHETYNPGALVRVTVFKLDGEEVEVWKGEDPTRPGDLKGVSVIPFKIDYKVNRVKLYIDSNKVEGWNEIDAVGLKDDKGKVQWASNAEASSTYAQNDVAAVPPPINPNILMMNEERIRKLENEVKELKLVIEEMKKKMDKK